jgi:hypothetical protein
MTTRTHTYLTAAASRARNEAEQFSSSGDGAAAELLLGEMEEAECLLNGARAVIRRTFRPLSLSGFGEAHDRMVDALDELTLLNERLDRGGPHPRPRFELVGRDDA